MQTVNDGKFEYKTKRLQILHKINSTFVSPIYTYLLAENIIFYTPIQDINGGKTLVILFTKE